MSYGIGSPVTLSLVGSEVGNADISTASPNLLLMISIRAST